MGKEKIEVQDIIKKYGKEYKENYKIMPQIALCTDNALKCIKFIG